MKRVSVDIGGTFTDCFVSWNGRRVQSKALTTHQSLAAGFHQALESGAEQLGIEVPELLAGVDSVRYATTLGTNALIERKGPRLGLLTTDGFRASVPLSRALGYAVGLDYDRQMDVANARRPDPIVPVEMIAEVRERIDYAGAVVLDLDEDDLRDKMRRLVDRGAEVLAVVLANSVVNPKHELRVREVFLEEYPGHMLGAIPMLLSHQVVGRKGEYVRAMSTIIDGFLHSVMYHGLGSLELHLRANGYNKPMLVNHNSGGMAQLNSTDALQTVHSGPVAGVAGSAHLAKASRLGNIVTADMGGTSFDIGLVVEGGMKFYDFNPVIHRWMVSVPTIHLVTLGAGGGSVASYERVSQTIKVGPESAGSDPGPACYDRGGLKPTVTDADLLLGYLDPANYAGGRIKLNPRRSVAAVEEELCDDLGLEALDVAKLIKRTVDESMANGIAVDLRKRGYEPENFTILAYGGNGPLHACGIANSLGVKRVLTPPFAAVFSAVGAGNTNQLHIHEKSIWMNLFDANEQRLLNDYAAFNEIVSELEGRGRDDLIRQGFAPEEIRHALELDMRYGNQRVETAVQMAKRRLFSQSDVLDLLSLFHRRYGERFGEGSQAAEAGVRINTFRVLSFVEQVSLEFRDVHPSKAPGAPPAPVGIRPCHFVGHDRPLKTPIYDAETVGTNVAIEGPAIVVSTATTYLIEPGWRYQSAAEGAVWFLKND